MLDNERDRWGSKKKSNAIASGRTPPARPRSFLCHDPSQKERAHKGSLGPKSSCVDLGSCRCCLTGDTDKGVLAEMVGWQTHARMIIDVQCSQIKSSGLDPDRDASASGL